MEHSRRSNRGSAIDLTCPQVNGGDRDPRTTFAPVQAEEPPPFSPKLQSLIALSIARRCICSKSTAQTLSQVETPTSSARPLRRSCPNTITHRRLIHRARGLSLPNHRSEVSHAKKAILGTVSCRLQVVAVSVPIKREHLASSRLPPRCPSFARRLHLRQPRIAWMQRSIG